MIDEHTAFITAPDGTRFQVLNEARDDWDEAATCAEYGSWLAKQTTP